MANRSTNQIGVLEAFEKLAFMLLNTSKYLNISNAQDRQDGIDPHRFKWMSVLASVIIMYATFFSKFFTMVKIITQQSML